MTDAALSDPRAATLALIDRLRRKGHDLLRQFTPNAQSQAFSAGSAPAEPKLGEANTSEGRGSAWDVEVRIWQNDCAAAINELSGGSKAHWLSRAYSGALLVRSTGGEAVVEADVAEIVFRVLDVLEQARRSIAGLDPGMPAPSDVPAPSDAPTPHRFDFVHDVRLRPVLEQAFADGTRAFEAGDFEQAMMTACGMIEAIITDSLQVRLKADPTTDTAHPVVRGVRLQPDLLNALSFDERIAAAEAAGLIRGGCARLPAVARAYRSADPHAAISEHDAKVTRQVLRVVMRDLDPGR